MSLQEDEDEEWFTENYSYDEAGNRGSPSQQQAGDASSLQIPMREPSPTSPPRDLYGELNFDSSLTVPLNDYQQFASEPSRLSPPPPTTSAVSYEQMTAVSSNTYETVQAVIPQTSEPYNSFEQPSMIINGGQVQYAQPFEDSVFQDSSSLQSHQHQQPREMHHHVVSMSPSVSSVSVSMEGNVQMLEMQPLRTVKIDQAQAQRQQHMQMQHFDVKPGTSYDDGGHFMMPSTSQPAMASNQQGIVTLARARQTPNRTTNGRKKPAAPKSKLQSLPPPLLPSQPPMMQSQRQVQQSQNEIRLSAESSIRMGQLASEMAQLKMQEQIQGVDNSTRIKEIENEIAAIISNPIQSHLDNETAAQIQQVAQAKAQPLPRAPPLPRSRPPPQPRPPRQRVSHTAVLHRQQIAQQQQQQQQQQHIIYNNSPQQPIHQQQAVVTQFVKRSQSPFQEKYVVQQQQQQLGLPQGIPSSPAQQHFIATTSAGNNLNAQTYVTHVEYVPVSSTEQYQQVPVQLQHIQQQAVLISEPQDIKPQFVTYRNSGVAVPSNVSYHHQQQIPSTSQAVTSSVPVSIYAPSAHSSTSNAHHHLQHSSAEQPSPSSSYSLAPAPAPPLPFPVKQQTSHTSALSITQSPTPLTISDGHTTLTVPPGTETVGDFIRQTTLGAIVGGRRLHGQGNKRSNSRAAIAAQQLLASRELITSSSSSAPSSAGPVPVSQLPAHITPPPAQVILPVATSRNLPGPSTQPAPLPPLPMPAPPKVILVPRNTTEQTRRRIGERRAIRQLRLNDFLDNWYENVKWPETERPFSDPRDMLERLLPFHMFYEPELRPEVLDDFDTNLLRMEVNNQTRFERVRQRMASLYIKEAMKETGPYEDNLMLFLDTEYERRALNSMKRETGDADVPEVDTVPLRYSQYEYNHQFDYNESKSSELPVAEVSPSPQPSSASPRSSLHSPLSSPAGRRSVPQLSSPRIKSPTSIPPPPVLSPIRMHPEANLEKIRPEKFSPSAAASLCSPIPSTSTADFNADKNGSKKKTKFEAAGLSDLISLQPLLRTSLPSLKLSGSILTASKNGNAKQHKKSAQPPKTLEQQQSLEFSADESEEEEEGPASPELGLDSSDIPITPTISKSLPPLSSPTASITSNRHLTPSDSLNHLTDDDKPRQKENLDAVQLVGHQPPPIKLKLKLGMPTQDVPEAVEGADEERHRKHHKKKKKKKHHKREREKDKNERKHDPERKKKEKRSKENKKEEKKLKNDAYGMEENEKQSLVTSSGLKIKLKLKGAASEPQTVAASSLASIGEKRLHKEEISLEPQLPAKIPKLKIKLGAAATTTGKTETERKKAEVRKEDAIQNGRLADVPHSKPLTNGQSLPPPSLPHSATFLRSPTKPPITSVEFSDSSDSETEREKLRSATDEALRDCGLTGVVGTGGPFGLRQPGSAASSIVPSSWPKTQQAP